MNQRFRDIIMNRPMPERVSPKIQPIELPMEKEDDLMFVNEVEEKKELKKEKEDINKKKEERIRKLIAEYRTKMAFTWKRFEEDLFKIL